MEENEEVNKEEKEIEEKKPDKIEKEEIKENQEEKNEKEPETKEKNKEQEQLGNQNKTLKNIFVVLGIITLIIIFGLIFINSARNFEYKGLTGQVIKEGELIFYQTSIPVLYKGEVVPYNFYLRTNPDKLKNMVFNGEVILLKNVVIKSSENFNCEGDGVIAIANLAKLYQVIGADVIKDENATCDSQGRYILLEIKKGNETSIEQTGPTCYNLNVNNCEILGVTEKLMLETLVKVKEEIRDEPLKISTLLMKM